MEHSCIDTDRDKAKYSKKHLSQCQPYVPYWLPWDRTQLCNERLATIRLSDGTVHAARPLTIRNLRLPVWARGRVNSSGPTWRISRQLCGGNSHPDDAVTAFITSSQNTFMVLNLCRTYDAPEMEMCLDLRSGTHYLELPANPFSGSTSR